MLKKSLLLLCAMLFSISSTFAFAVPVDLTSITNAVDFTTVIAAVLLVAAALAGVYVAWKGVEIILVSLHYSRHGHYFRKKADEDDWGNVFTEEYKYENCMNFFERFIYYVKTRTARFTGL